MMHPFRTGKKMMNFGWMIPAVVVVLSGISPEAGAGNYRYTDRSGQAHFTDRLESIPKEYRDRIQPDLKEPPKASREENQGGQTAPPQATGKAPSGNPREEGVQKE